MAHLTCPTCRLALRPRTLLAAPDYCPRCLARRRTPVLLDYVPDPPLPARPERPGGAGAAPGDADGAALGG